MYKEQATIETTKKPEAQENHEVSQSIESPEDLCQQMMSESGKETDHFKSECADDIAKTETRAEKDGLAIDGEDKKALVNLGAEADAAKKELEVEIGDKNESKEKMPTKEQQDAFEIGKEKVLSLQAEGNDKSPEYWALYSHLTEGLGKDIQWRNAGDINAEKVNEMLASKFPEKDQLVTRTCPKCGREYTGTDSSYCTCGGELVLKEPEIDSKMEEKVVKKEKLLNKKEASKKFLAEERKKLAEEIHTQRKLQHDRLSALKITIEKAINASEGIDNQHQDKQYAQLAEIQSAEANAIAERISSSELSDKDATDERENIGQLIDNSDGVNSLKKKLKEHYAKADEIAQKKFESVKKTVEQTLLRTNVFIVHAIQVDERNRHNENSNISKKATQEDDLDILLSLEPSISTSSVMSGVRQGLWENRIGVVLGGGEIRGVTQTDNGTLPEGVSGRNGKISTAEEIDKAVSDRGERGYNELVVNNPKVFGFYQNVDIDEFGKMIGFSDSRSNVTNMEYKDDFMKYIDLAKEKGMPPLIMTPDRRLFEFLSIGDDGIVSVGLEITPEQVALGKAGMSNEDRAKLGTDIISKHLFKNIQHHQEAKKIITKLEGKEEITELSKEEYIAQLEKHPEEFNSRLGKYPNSLLEDKSFMLEAARINPEGVLFVLGNKSLRKLLEDKDFIKSILTSIPEDKKNSEILRRVPREFIDKDIASFAIDHNDKLGNYVLSEELFNDPEIKERLIRMSAGDFHIVPLDREKVHVSSPDFGFINSKGAPVRYPINEDKIFLEKIRQKYDGMYKIEPSYDGLLISKI